MSMSIGGKKRTALNKVMAASAVGGQLKVSDLNAAISSLETMLEKTSTAFPEAGDKEKEVPAVEISKATEFPKMTGGGDYPFGTGPGYNEKKKFKNVDDILKAMKANAGNSQHSFENISDQLKDAIVPLYDSRYAKGSEDNFEGQARLQALSQQFLGSISNPSLSLFYLNELQRKMPFMMADPRPQMFARKPKVVKYGYADLFRFMGHPFGPGMARVKENPFYHPISYPIPDPAANRALLSMLDSNSIQKLHKLKEIVGNSRKRVFLPGDSDYAKITGLMHDIMADRYDPDRILVRMPGQERPMASYRLNNIHRLLTNMMVAHEIYGPVGYAKEGMVQVDIQKPKGAEMVARGGGHKRRRKGSKRKSHRKSSKRHRKSAGAIILITDAKDKRKSKKRKSSKRHRKSH